MNMQNKSGYVVLVALSAIGLASLVGLVDRSHGPRAALAAQAQQAPIQLQTDGPVYSTGKLGPAPGILPLYNFDGTMISGGRCAQGIITSNASGQWSVDYTALGFTNITSFRADSANPTNNSSLLSNQYSISMNPPTLTSFSGTVKTQSAVTILSISVPIIAFATTASQVSVGVCGS